jgi:hypothetical protein
MNAVMSTERIRLIIDTDDVVRRAVGLRKLKMPSGTTNSDVVNEILRAALAEEIAQVEGYEQEASDKRKSKKKGGEKG